MTFAQVVMSDSEDVSKQHIAEQFSRAAQHYDGVAQVQHDIARWAMTHLPSGMEHVLDVGCGTGRETCELLTKANLVTGVDLADGMLAVARQRSDVIHWQRGDAEQLPFAEGQFDGVFSSMALQWCQQPEVVLAQAQRVLRAGGSGVYAMMTQGSFKELRDSCEQLGVVAPVNRFLSFQRWLNAARNVGLRVSATEQRFVTYHDTLFSLLHSVKDVGANVVTVQRSAPMSRQDFRRLASVYEARYGTQRGLPLSYCVTALRFKKAD
ncbi:methyltransferase domain-containing protein [Aestuariibacter halophilus]|uniref:Malonyl-[acyl-carrier protein] O-methyltransferase n=1 Tax=Fluctibacter halophilus TaxID=226011 RepID=A0ABS8G6D0_9ALTE|nr:methyltransferase domain-containing protein [Aestuariibacter halophilus]MCC2616078.1 methyltransferase domain-containing protein [Aestuariibacter halophilus]